jgi:hypothetical protein
MNNKPINKPFLVFESTLTMRTPKIQYYFVKSFFFKQKQKL